MVPLKPIFSKSARMEADAPITLLNRHTGRMETEQVYGEKWLRRIYGNPLGKLTLHTVVKRALFSKLYGWAMDRPSSARRVAPFVKAFGLDPAEFADSDLKSYRTFNDFFYRKLKAGARPVDPRAEMAVLPADGRHLGFPDASRVNGIFAKGQTFDMGALVADRVLGERYARGTVVCSRLCPVDYHRFHFPVAGVPGEPVLAQGSLYSVNPIALRRSAAYLWQNKRQRVTIDAGPFGLVTMVSIGATNVGTIIETYKPGQAVAKGDEKGYFRFGGSYVATIFEPGRIKLEDDLIHAGETAVEVYAKVGSPLGRLA
jgi:phosphatidylserine decarboxylase